MQLCAGLQLVCKPTAGTRLKAGSKEWGLSAKLDLLPLEAGTGSPCHAEGHGRQWLTSASSDSHELKQLEPEARSAVSVPGLRVTLARCASLCTSLHALSPELAEALQGLAPFHSGSMTFPLGRGLGSAAIKVCFSVLAPSCFSSQ